MNLAPLARTAVAWAWLAAFALMMGWVLARGLAFHQPRETPWQWGDARWIGLDPADEKLYLRRQVVLGSLPASARLQVAASEHFEVFVNGALIGREDFLSARPSAAFDLTRLLRPGVNTLAIGVTKSTRSMPAGALVSLEWQEGQGTRRVVSDETWRAESRRQLEAAGALDWNAAAFDDSAWRWARAREATPEARPPLMQPDSLDPQLFEPPLRADRIWHGDPQSGVGAFERLLPLDAASVSAGWLGASVDGTVLVSVNGHVLGPIEGDVTRMDVLDIAPFLRPGDNRIAVQVSGGRAPMRLAIAGRVITDQGPVDFSSDERWQQAAGKGPVSVLSGGESARPAMTLARKRPTQEWRRTQLMRWLGHSALVGLALAAIGFVTTRGHRSERRANAWNRYAQPWAAAALLLGMALLAGLDARVSLEPYYGFWLPAAALLLAALVAIALTWRRAAPTDEFA